MIRLILALLFAILYLIIGIPVLGVEWIIAKFNKQAADLGQLRMVQWAFRVILFICGTKVTVIGEENVPKDQAVLYIGNHRSYFDIIITYARCPRLTGYIAKKDMEKVPLLRTWMRRLHCLFIDRENVKEALKTILAGIDNVKNGISMCIFPNSADVLEAHIPRVKKAHVIVEYGKPIYPNELDKEQKKKIGAYCQDVIAEMLEKNKVMI